MLVKSFLGSVEVRQRSTQHTGLRYHSGTLSDSIISLSVTIVIHFITVLFALFFSFSILQVMYISLLCEVIPSTLTSCFLQFNFITFFVNLGVFVNLISIYTKVGSFLRGAGDYSALQNAQTNWKRISLLLNWYRRLFLFVVGE